LRRVAKAIKGTLRQGDSLYRYGGEEFAVVLSEQCLADATLAMERVRRAVEELAIGQRDGGVLTICVGVAELDPLRDPSVQAWMERADAALYRAKARGRNCVLAHDTRATG
jgi:diguanylate cyclase (GGDEF)-like protein